MGDGAQPLSLLLRRLAFERERALMLLGERQFIPPSVLDMLDHQSVERGTGLAIEIVIGLRRSREPRFPAFFGGFASIKHGDAMRPIEIRAVSMPVFGGWQRPARHRFISDQDRKSTRLNSSH